MIPSVNHDCEAWARHKLWLTFGSHGWPPLSFLGRLIKEGPGIWQGSYKPVVLVKDSPKEYMLINGALVKMTETHEMYKPWLVIHAHYLVRGKAKIKAPELDLSVSQYWNELHVGHSYIVGCTPAQDVPREAEPYRQFLASA